MRLRQHALVKSGATAERYEKQMQTMFENATTWRKQNPERAVLVQFNYPRTVFLIASISDAIKHKYVVTNEAGLHLLMALWPWGAQDEPTVGMCRTVLEHEPKRKS